MVKAKPSTRVRQAGFLPASSKGALPFLRITTPQRPPAKPSMASRQDHGESEAAYCATRQGERVFRVLNRAVAQAVVLSLWQRLQALGIF